MEMDQQARQLHDKVTRGIKLSPEEQARLEAWYVQQDAAETALLASSSPHESLADLRTQVNTSVAQLLSVTQRVQDLSHQNDDLRDEITALKQQIVSSRHY